MPVYIRLNNQVSHHIIGMMSERDVACAPCLGGFQQSPPSGSSAGKTVERQLLPIHPTALDLDHLQPRDLSQRPWIGKLIGGPSASRQTWMAETFSGRFKRRLCSQTKYARARLSIPPETAIITHSPSGSTGHLRRGTAQFS